MKKFLKNALARVQKLHVAGGIMLASGAAAADTTSYIPSLTGFYAQITSDFGSVTALAWPFVFVTTGTAIGIALFKRFSKKAT